MRMKKENLQVSFFDCVVRSLNWIDLGMKYFHRVAWIGLPKIYFLGCSYNFRSKKSFEMDFLKRVLKFTFFGTNLHFVQNIISTLLTHDTLYGSSPRTLFK